MAVRVLDWGIVRVDEYVAMYGDELWLDYSTLSDVLDAVLGVGRRFRTAEGVFYDALRATFKTPFLFADTLYRVRRLQPYQVDSWWEKWLGKLQLGYRSEVFDCDNYSSLLASLAAAELGTNAVLRAWGELCIVKDDGSEDCGGHAYNVVVSLLHAYPEHAHAYLAVFVYEPQTATAMLPDTDGVARMKVSGLGILEYRTASILGW